MIINKLTFSLDDNKIKNNKNIYYDFFINYLRKKNQSINLEHISKNVELIKKNILKYKKILCWGDVQSGKTNNYIATALSFLDDNHDIVIFINGHITKLYNQTENRIKDIKLSEIGITILNKKNLHFLNEFDFQHGDKVIINIPKFHNSLQEIINLLNLQNLSDYKIAIFDDESDFASINTKKDLSKIYKQISEIKELKTDNIDLIQITATPYAHMMSSQSPTTNPDIVIKLNKSQDYTGINYFMYNNIYKQIKNNELEDQEKLLTKVLKSYFISTLFSKVISQKKNNTFECVINIDTQKQSHTNLKRKVKNIFNVFEKAVSDVRAFKEYFKEELTPYYKIYKSDNDDCCKILEKEIKNTAKKIINKNEINICILNGNAENKNYNPQKGLNIIIGGHILSRGLTFEYLLTSIMLNVPKSKISADTLLQRSRWFGYRKNKANWTNFMQIFILEKAYKAYEEIIELNSWLDNEFKNNVLENSIQFSKKLKEQSKEYECIKLTSDVKSR